MVTDATLLDEHHDINLWQTPPVILTPVSGALRSFQNAQTRAAATYSDKSVGHAYGTDQSLLPPLGNDLEKFGQWPSVASTIWNKLIHMTGFNPSDVDFDSSVFTAYKTKFSTCPFWNGLEFNILYRDVTLRIRDYREAVNAVIDLLTVGISQGTVTSILDNIKHIAQLASINVHQQQKQTMFHNGSLCITNGRLYVFFLYNAVQMTASQGKYTVIDQNCKIVRGYGVLDFDFCKRHASSILTFDDQSLNNWLGEAGANSQPPNTSDGWP